MATKQDALINLLNISYEEQKRYLATLTGEERAAVGAVDDWSPKDALAHVIHWDADAAANIADPDNTIPADFDESTNDNLWKQYKEITWEKIEDLTDRTHGDLVAGVQGLTEDQLTDPDRFEWTTGRSLLRSLTFTNFSHPLQHIAELYSKRGDMAYANEMEEQAAELQMPLVDDDQWRGTVLYNLGCHYAITGQKQKALESVRQGLELHPSLKEWAPQDSDLKSIHDDPEFKVLLD
jgi:tetratricopeptide (TPR) repeat protein